MTSALIIWAKMVDAKIEFTLVRVKRLEEDQRKENINSTNEDFSPF